MISYPISHTIVGWQPYFFVDGTPDKTEIKIAVIKLGALHPKVGSWDDSLW